AERRKTGGRQGLEPSVHACPQVGEDPEGGVVADQPLSVAQEASRQREELHADDGEAQGRLGWPLGRSRDQPGRGGQQADGGPDRSCSEEGGQGEPSSRRAGDGEGPAQPAHLAAPSGTRLTARSARATSSGRWATSRTVRPSTRRRTPPRTVS